MSAVLHKEFQCIVERSNNQYDNLNTNKVKRPTGCSFSVKSFKYHFCSVFLCISLCVFSLLTVFLVNCVILKWFINKVGLKWFFNILVEKCIILKKRNEFINTTMLQ